MEISYLINRLREERGWSQDDLAFRANTSAATISRLEKDKQTPSLDLLKGLASAFDMHLYQFAALLDEAGPSNLTEWHDSAEQELLNGFRQLSDEQRTTLLKFCVWLTAANKAVG
ncbi:MULTISPECIES: helix-turn-helix domain-containing protein [Deefgea]|nr:MULTISPECIES: helix-turn-helix transcriptional regulator [Deefgea]MBM9887968.1 helix-turn-helix transcriptional regulator [Deefgea sp. CFH1-16]